MQTVHIVLLDSSNYKCITMYYKPNVQSSRYVAYISDVMSFDIM